jgi:hypothetical protein
MQLLQLPVVFQVNGTFDIPAVYDLQKAIADLPNAVAVIVDFTHVRELCDFALAIFVPETVGIPQCVSIRGLRSHHHTLLRYLKIPHGEGGAVSTTASRRA